MVWFSEPVNLVEDSGLRHRPLELLPPGIRKVDWISCVQAWWREVELSHSLRSTMRCRQPLMQDLQRDKLLFSRARRLTDDQRIMCVVSSHSVSSVKTKINISESVKVRTTRFCFRKNKRYQHYYNSPQNLAQFYKK